MIEQLLSPELVSALGWTLVHTLWQGAAFALLLGGLLVALRRFSSQARYVVAVGLLGAFFLTVGTTFTRMYQSPVPGSATVIPGGEPVTTTARLSEGVGADPDSYRGAEPINYAAPERGFQSRLTSYYQDHLPLIVTLWLMGVLVLQLRWLGELAYVQRLKSYGTSRIPGHWLERIGELEDRLEIRRPIRYLTSHRVPSPLTVGWLRPVVLFPPALLEELKDSQVMAILAHELAHVRRHDFLVNLAQTLLGTLFFFHPGVWWMNARIAEEREHCCDDLAIAATGEPAGYARTLVRLKEAHGGRGQLALGFTGTAPSAFQQRIVRLFGGGGAATYGEGVLTAGILVVALLAVNLVTGGMPGGHEPTVATLTLAPADREETPGDTLPEHAAEVNAIIADVQRKVEEFSTEQALRPTQDPAEFVAEFIEKLQEGQKENELEALELTTELGRLPTNLSDFELLMEAIWAENLRLVEHFLDKVTDLNQTDDRGFTPLMAAASENALVILDLLLERGAEVDFANNRGWTALIEAADEGSTDCLIRLLKAGAEMEQTDYAGRSAVTMAASEGHLNDLRFLLDQGARLTPEGGQSPLHAAASEGHIDVLRFLLGERLVDVNAEDGNGRTALSYAAENEQHRIVAFLMENGAEYDGDDTYLRGYVENTDRNEHQYDRHDDDDRHRHLRGRGTVSRHSFSDEEGHYDSYYPEDREGRSQFEVIEQDNPLMLAVRLQDISDIGRILKRGTDVNQTTAKISGLVPPGYDWSDPKNSDLATLRQLEDLRYDVTGWTALMEAAEAGHGGIAEMLLAAGADKGLKDSEGRTAYDLALENGHAYLMVLLKPE